MNPSCLFASRYNLTNTSVRDNAAISAVMDLKRQIIGLHLILLYSSFLRNRDNAVGIATSYELDYRVTRVRITVRATLSKPSLGPNLPPVHWVRRALLLGGKADST
jgi:hypothetical protein